MQPCQVSCRQKESTVNYMKTRIELKQMGKQLSTKTEIQSFGRVFF